MSKLSFGAYAFEKVRCTTIQIRGNEEKNSVKLIYHFKVYLENVTKFCMYSSLVACMITLKVWHLPLVCSANALTNWSHKDNLGIYIMVENAHNTSVEAL
jgi:hypothetical protein